MTFLAPWALLVGAMGAAAAVLLHLVARQRPAAYLLPTTRFIPDQRTLVSRMARRPRDLLLLALRVLLLLAAGAAFARPILTPARGAIARIVLLDRSRAVADAADAVVRTRELLSDGVPTTIIAFDSTPRAIAAASLDSIASAPRSDAIGSLSAALIAARRAGVAMAERADSVQLVIVSPLVASEMDSATRRLRTEWPGGVRLERTGMREGTDTTWNLEHPLSIRDPLGPATSALHAVAGRRATRLVRTELTASDSAVALSGNTVVRWDTASTGISTANGVLVGDEVVVASLARARLPGAGRAIAHWADGTPAAVEAAVGSGCIRHVGVTLPAAGDLPLHPPFQRMARALLKPCGAWSPERLADSSLVAALAGTSARAAPAAMLGTNARRKSPLTPWLLAAAMLFALAELLVRARTSEVQE